MRADRADGAAAQPAPEAGEADAADLPAITYSFARKHQVVPDGVTTDGRARVLCPATPAPEILAELRRHLGRPLALEKLDPGTFETRLQGAFAGGADSAHDAADSLDAELDLEAAAESLDSQADLLESQDDAPIVRLINALLAEAIREGASDVHIEPFEHRLRVRVRVDGVLREVFAGRPGLAPLLVSRIKVMARLDIAEKRLPQDGRIALNVGGRSVDVRVATLPGAAGERVVLRLLDKEAGKLELGELGLPERELAVFDRLIHKPHGIVLVTGPTGSGKTTTLYAALSRLNDRQRNMLTVEDPVEYDLPGVSQTQVNPKVDLDFAKALRAILRQDPDVIMVGEVRDLETAEIAVQASLTGHLVLSTLHTNTAVGAITRLRDMKVPDFLLASTLSGVMAQRLVRLLCPDCKHPYTAETRDERDLLELPASAAAPTLYAPVGCPACNHSGYRGRKGVYELVAVDDTLRQLIHDGAGEHALEAEARRHAPDLRRAGLASVLSGETSLAELVRVTRGD